MRKTLIDGIRAICYEVGDISVIIYCDRAINIIGRAGAPALQQAIDIANNFELIYNSIKEVS